MRTCALVLFLAVLASANNIEHFFFLILENTDYDIALAQPYLSELAKNGTLLTNYYAITHPSQPNYVAIGGASTFGVNAASGPVTIRERNIFDLMQEKGVSWKSYQQNYPGGPGNCYNLDAYPYARRHNSPILYESVTNSSMCDNIVEASVLDEDIANGTLPRFIFYTPNINNCGHDTGAAYADRWLRSFLEPHLKNPALMNNTLLMVTYDEDSYKLANNHIYAVLLGPDVPVGAIDWTPYDHYDLVRTIETIFDLGTLGRNDDTAYPFLTVLNLLNKTVDPQIYNPPPPPPPPPVPSPPPPPVQAPPPETPTGPLPQSPWYGQPLPSPFKRVITIVLSKVGLASALQHKWWTTSPMKTVLLTNSYRVTWGTTGNRIAMLAGDSFDSFAWAGKFGGLGASSIFHLLESRGIEWGVYAEDYPGNCSSLSEDGFYHLTDNAPLLFEFVTDNETLCQNVRSLNEFNAADLPPFSIIYPNEFHSGAVGGAIDAMDWLNLTMTTLFQNATFMADTLIIATADQQDTSDYTPLFTLLASPLLAVNVNNEDEHKYVSHYALLSTWERVFNLTELGRNDSLARGFAPVELVLYGDRSQLSAQSLDDDDNGLSARQVAGIVCSILVLMIVIAVTLIVVMRRHWRVRPQRLTPATSPAVGSAPPPAITGTSPGGGRFQALEESSEGHSPDQGVPMQRLKKGATTSSPSVGDRRSPYIASAAVAGAGSTASPSTRRRTRGTPETPVQEIADPMLGGMKIRPLSNQQ